MSEYVKVNGIKNLRKALERGQRNIRKAVDKAIWSTAQKAVPVIRKRVPVAFGELKSSVQAYPRGLSGNPVTSVDAPHAGAVEIGSLPHKPNFERLLAWVRLRGMQGLNPSGKSLKKRFPKALGFTTPRHAPRISSLLKSLEVRGKRGVGRHSPVDAAVQVARAISAGIEKHGTRPVWYVRESLPEIRGILNAEIQKNLRNVRSASSSGGPTMRVTDEELAGEAYSPTMRVKDSELF